MIDFYILEDPATWIEPGIALINDSMIYLLYQN